MVGNQAKDDTTSTELEDGDPMRVIVADDDPFARRMIKESLQRAGVIVVAEAPDGRQAVELTLFYRPDVVLMDVVMPEIDGISATRQIVQEIPDQLIVMLTSSDETEIGFVGLRAGAVGYLSKDVDVDVLPQALRGTLRGEAAISRRLSMQLIEQLRRAPDVSSGMRPVRSPLDGARMGGRRPPVSGPFDRRDRRRPGAVARDRPLAHQEPHAQARRQDARRGRRTRAQGARRRPADSMTAPGRQAGSVK